MKKEIFELINNITKIVIDFEDAGVNLKGETTVRGSIQEAEKYAVVFERDLRRNNKDLFPQLEPEILEEEEMIE